MRIADYRIITMAETLERIRDTPLRGFNHAKPYADAVVSIQNIDVSSIVPAQRYVLKKQVDIVIDLYNSMLDLGIDIFRLYGALFFRIEYEDGQLSDEIPFLPPVVELSKEDDGSVILLNDGMHRIYASRLVRRIPNVICIVGVPDEYPYYAYPESNLTWDSVKVLDEMPGGYQKKVYRNPDDYKALFRQFNVTFPGVQSDRSRK